MERFVIRLDVVFDSDDAHAADKKCLEFCRAVAVVPGHLSKERTSYLTEHLSDSPPR